MRGEYGGAVGDEEVAAEGGGERRRRHAKRRGEVSSWEETVFGKDSCFDPDASMVELAPSGPLVYDKQNRHRSSM